MIRKALVFFVVVASYAHSHYVGTPTFQTSSSSIKQAGPVKSYSFGYGIINGQGGSHSRSEEGDEYGNKRGAYFITDADGRTRRVDYIADQYGFRVAITTNELGTAESAPAGVYVIKPSSSSSSTSSSTSSRRQYQIPVPAASTVTEDYKPIKLPNRRYRVEYRKRFNPSDRTSTTTSKPYYRRHY